jgi:putative Mg2+ transporter-C (MgtC) family protein
MEFKIIFVRLLITFILAFIFGIERQRSHKPVGFGTFIFVAIGSCGLSLIAIDLGKENPLPLLSAIVTGIGFLGAGALIKTTDRIFGFTTAASIWLFAIIGLIIGTGYYNIGLLIYTFVWISLFIDKKIENGKIGSYQKRINLELNNINDESKIIDLFDKFKIKRYKLLYKKINKKEKKFGISYLVKGSGKNLRELIENLGKIPSFIEINLE